MKKLIYAFAVSISLLSLTSCSTRIDGGAEGILVQDYGSSKGVQDIALASGRVWYNPFTETVYETDLYVKTIDYDPFTVNDKDGSEFVVDPKISLKVIPGSTPHIFRKYRKDVDEVFETTVYTYTQDAYRIVFNSFKTDSVISHRAQFEKGVEDLLRLKLKADGISLENLTSGLQYPATIIAAVNAKNTAVQHAMQIDNEVKTTEAEARKKIAKAEGDATALKIQADAEAYAYKARQSALTPLIVQQQFIEKWDGKLPVYGQVPSMFKSVQ